MADPIPPIGSLYYTRPPGDSNQQAKALAKSTGQFIDLSYTLLRDTAQVDNSEFLSQYADLIKNLHKQCQKIKNS